MGTSNGTRTYHSSEAPYTLPADDLEGYRLNQWHISLKHYFRSNFRAPIENPTSILDLGTGSGIWAVEMAEQFPEATVLGVDMSPVASTSHPKNCSFSQVNLAKEWPFEPNSFDIIHTRYVLIHLPNAKDVIEKSIIALKPGGFLLFDEIQHSIEDDESPVSPGINRFLNLYHSYMADRGVDRDIAQKMEFILRDSNCFLEVNTYMLKCPWGAWTNYERLDRLGSAFPPFVTRGYTALKESMTAGGLTRGVIDAAIQELSVDGTKLYMPVYLVWARKKL